MRVARVEGAALFLLPLTGMTIVARSNRPATARPKAVAAKMIASAISSNVRPYSVAIEPSSFWIGTTSRANSRLIVSMVHRGEALAPPDTSAVRVLPRDRRTPDLRTRLTAWNGPPSSTTWS